MSLNAHTAQAAVNEICHFHQINPHNVNVEHVWDYAETNDISTELLLNTLSYMYDVYNIIRTSSNDWETREMAATQMFSFDEMYEDVVESEDTDYDSDDGSDDGSVHVEELLAAPAPAVVTQTTDAVQQNDEIDVYFDDIQTPPVLMHERAVADYEEEDDDAWLFPYEQLQPTRTPVGFIELDHTSNNYVRNVRRRLF